MKETRTFNVELTEFAAQLIVWIMQSDHAQEHAYSLIDRKLPDDADTAGLTREEYILALQGRLDSAITAIQVSLFDSQKEAA